MLNSEFKDKEPGVILMHAGFRPYLLYRDPEIIEQLFVTYNKYFDKSDSTKEVFHYLLGESLLFDQSGELWSKKRKIMSVAFYKDKLIKMIDIVK